MSKSKLDSSSTSLHHQIQSPTDQPIDSNSKPILKPNLIQVQPLKTSDLQTSYAQQLDHHEDLVSTMDSIVDF